MNPVRSLRMVLASVGSRGDVQPMLALAQVLAARGHVPLIAAPANFESWVRSLGFDFAPLGDDVQVFLAENRQIMTGKPLRMLREMIRYFREQIPLQAQQLAPICQGADLLVYGGLAFTAPSVAEHLRLPVLGVLYSNCLLPSSQHPPPNIPWHGLPAWLNNLFWRINHVLGDLLLRGTLNTLRSSFGLPPVDHLRRHMIEDHPLIIAADEVIFPPDPMWQGRFPYANFIFFDDPSPLDPELEAWLGDGDPPVFIGFGSMSGQGIERVERMIVEATTNTGRRCIVDAGWVGLADAICAALELPPGPRQAAAVRLKASDGRASIAQRIEALCEFPVGKT